MRYGRVNVGSEKDARAGSRRAYACFTMCVDVLYNRWMHVPGMYMFLETPGKSGGIPSMWSVDEGCMIRGRGRG